MYTLISMILYSSIISTPVSMTKNQYPPNSGLDIQRGASVWVGSPKSGLKGWDETTCILVSWRQGFRHPTRNECMSWFAQIWIEGLGRNNMYIGSLEVRV